MTKEQEQKCHAIIHTASTAAGATSAFTSQIPFADSAVIIPAQMTMVIGLAKVFGYDLGEGFVRSLISPMVVQELGKGAAKQLVGMIPIAGNLVKAGVSVSFTEALGWIIANEFAKGSAVDMSPEGIFSNIRDAVSKR